MIELSEPVSKIFGFVRVGVRVQVKDLWFCKYLTRTVTQTRVRTRPNPFQVKMKVSCHQRLVLF